MKVVKYFFIFFILTACDRVEKKTTAESHYNVISGTYSMYTKHSKCEMVKTSIVFNNDSTVSYHRFCMNDAAGISSVAPIKRTGHWEPINDTIIKVSLGNNDISHFKVLSSSSIEMQTNDTYSKPTFTKDSTNLYDYR